MAAYGKVDPHGVFPGSLDGSGPSASDPMHSIMFEKAFAKVVPLGKDGQVVTTEVFIKWTRDVTALFRNMRLLSIVDGSYPCPTPNDPVLGNAPFDAWRKGDERALEMIHLVVADYEATKIDHVTTSHEAWDTIRLAYALTGPEATNALLRQLYNIQSATYPSNMDYIAGFLDLIARIRMTVPSTEVIIPEGQLPSLFQQGLDPTYWHLLDIEDALARTTGRGATLQHYIKAIEKDYIRTTLRSQVDNKPSRLIYGMSTPSSTSVAPRPVCTYCTSIGRSGMGHHVDNCWQLHPERKRSRKKATDGKDNDGKEGAGRNVSGATIDGRPFTAEDVPELLRRMTTLLTIHPSMHHNGLLATTISGSQTWLADSAASAHACGIFNLFHNYEPVDNWNFLGADGSSIQVAGFGSITFEATEAIHGVPSVFTLKNVAYVPDLQLNVISTGALLNRHGAAIYEKSLVSAPNGPPVKGEEWEFCLDGHRIMSGRRIPGNLFQINIVARRPGKRFQDRNLTVIREVTGANQVDSNTSVDGGVATV